MSDLKGKCARYLISMVHRNFEHGVNDCLTLAGAWALLCGADDRQKRLLAEFRNMAEQHGDWMGVQRAYSPDDAADCLDRFANRCPAEDGAIGLHRNGNGWALVVVLDGQGWGWDQPSGRIGVLCYWPAECWRVC